MVVPTVHTPLCADALGRSVQDGLCQIPDHRKGDAALPLREALRSAWVMCALNSPSVLALAKGRAADTLHRISGLGRVPCATSRRESLDPVKPAHLSPALNAVLRHLPRGRALAERSCVEGHSLFALDGPGSFSSQEMHCDSCLAHHHRQGTVPSAHPLFGAPCIPRDKRAGSPLMPAPLVNQDGTEKNAGERNAAHRGVTTLRRDHPTLKVMGPAESLRSQAPHIETFHQHDRHDLLGGKESAHAFVCTPGAEADQAGRVTSEDREERQQGLHHRLRLVGGRPLTASNASLRVTGIECWETGGYQVQHGSWGTDVCVPQGTVDRIMPGARARWRLAKETFNTRNKHGEHGEHNGGHGSEPLSVGFAEWMMWAFLGDQGPQRCCPRGQAA